MHHTSQALSTNLERRAWAKLTRISQRRPWMTSGSTGVTETPAGRLNKTRVHAKQLKTKNIHTLAGQRWLFGSDSPFGQNYRYVLRWLVLLKKEGKLNGAAKQVIVIRVMKLVRSLFKRLTLEKGVKSDMEAVCLIQSGQIPTFK